MIADDDKAYPIPEKFRVSLDLTDEAAHALLKKCDAEQKLLAKKINSPFTRTSPRESQRAKAYITIKALLEAEQFQRLTEDQHEQLAEAWAAVGRYDLANLATKTRKKEYRAIWNADHNSRRCRWP